MIFEQNKFIEKFGEMMGYAVAYFLFTTVLYLILTLLNKHSSWTYMHIMGITFLIALIGIIIGRLLK